MLKKIIFIFILCGITTIAFTDETRVIINGRRVRFNQTLRTEQNTLLAPIQPVADLLKAETRWNTETQTITIIYGNTGVAASIGNTVMAVRNMTTGVIQNVILPIAPLNINGVNYFPVESMVRALGLTVTRDVSSNELHIMTQDYVPRTPQPTRYKNYLDLSFYIQWQHGGEYIDGALIVYFTGGATWSPLPFTSIGVEGFFGGITYENEDDPEGKEGRILYYGISPSVGLVIPVASTQLFSNFILEIGNFGIWKGIITENITPGFDIGISFSETIESPVFTIRYKGLFFENVYTHGIGFTYGIRWR